MGDTAASRATMRGRAIRAYGEEMVLMDDLPIRTRVTRDEVVLINAAAGGVGASCTAMCVLDLVLTRHARGKVVLKIA